MARDFYVANEVMVAVKLGQHWSGVSTVGATSGSYITSLTQLGLTAKPVRILPRYYHTDIHADDFGPRVPAELMYNLAEVRVQTELVHYDSLLARICWAESQAGATRPLNTNGVPGPVPNEGFLAPAGSLQGNGLPRFASGNYYIGLNLITGPQTLDWRFYSAVLTEAPWELPIGSEKSVLVMNWRCIPYRPIINTSVGNTITVGAGNNAIDLSGNIIGGTGTYVFNAPGIVFSEVSSSGVQLYDHLLDS